MSPAAKRKLQQIQDSIHLGKDGFDWKGDGVRKYGIIVVGSLLAIGLGLLLVWALHTFPNLLIAKTDRVAASSASIEKKLDSLRQDDTKYQRKTDKQLKQLTESIAVIQEVLVARQAYMKSGER